MSMGVFLITSAGNIIFCYLPQNLHFYLFFFRITQYNLETHNARTFTPKRTHVTATPMSIFEDLADKS